MAALPIWKDHVTDLGELDSSEFRIAVGSSSGKVIYQGRAFLRPGETNIKIRTNDICADYLRNTVPNLSQAEFTALTFPVKFFIQRLNGDAWTDVENVEFMNDWSYDYSYSVASMGMAFPINGRIDRRQWLTYTAYNATTITAVLTFANGTTSTVYVPIALSNDFNNDFNDDFSRSTRAAGSGTAVFDLSPWSNVAKVTIGSKTWNVVTDCAEWVLYYVNAYGGWDSLLIEGNVTERDSLTRHVMNVEYDNRDIKNRGKRNSVNEVQKGYTLNTGWLSDEESSRMHHLLNSTEVYLGNIGSGQMIPVIVENTANDYKTYKNNGNRLVSYSIDVTVAQDRVRR